MKEKGNGTAAVVTVQYLEQEYVSSDNNSSMVFSGAQTVRFEDEEDPKVISDFGSTLTLARYNNF